MYTLKYIPNQSSIEKTMVVNSIDEFVSYTKENTVLAYEKSGSVYRVKVGMYDDVEKVFQLIKLVDNPILIMYQYGERSLQRLFNKYVMKII